MKSSTRVIDPNIVISIYQSQNSDIMCKDGKIVSKINLCFFNPRIEIYVSISNNLSSL